MKKPKKKKEVKLIVAEKFDGPLVGHDKIMADIARLKQQEIDSGAWDIWKESQRRMGWDPDHQATAAPPEGRITALMFEMATGAPPQRDDLERCNCPSAGTPGHFTCGWCNDCNRPRFMCPHPLSRRVTMTVPRRGR